MSIFLTEALLEMHFHRAILEYFRALYGAKFFRLLKPSRQLEVWVGFDQGWVRTSLTDQQLFDELRRSIQSSATTVNHFYLGYFLQFKTVQRITRKSKYMPFGYTPPYYRSELSVDPSRTTGLSQHETLLRLSRIKATGVCYACPMVFEPNEIYGDPDLDHLRCVEIFSSPTGWPADQRHFIAFRDVTDRNPRWCSESFQGEAFSFREWASPSSGIGLTKLSAEQIMDLIEKLASEVRMAIGEPEPPSFWKDFKGITRLLPESFILMEFRSTSNNSEKKVKPKTRKIRFRS